MKKKTLWHKLLSLSLILTVILGLSACGKEEAKNLGLPKSDQVASITVKHSQSPENSEGVTLTQDLAPLIDLLNKEAQWTKKESVNDQPTNIDDYMILEFYENPPQDNPKKVTLYQSKGKYYVEEAYQGIWEMSQEAYEQILDKIEEEAKITPAY